MAVTRFGVDGLALVMVVIVALPCGAGEFPSESFTLSGFGNNGSNPIVVCLVLVSELRVETFFYLPGLDRGDARCRHSLGSVVTADPTPEILIVGLAFDSYQRHYQV